MIVLSSMVCGLIKLGKFEEMIELHRLYCCVIMDKCKLESLKINIIINAHSPRFIHDIKATRTYLSMKSGARPRRSAAGAAVKVRTRPDPGRPGEDCGGVAQRVGNETQLGRLARRGRQSGQADHQDVGNVAGKRGADHATTIA